MPLRTPLGLSICVHMIMEDWIFIKFDIAGFYKQTKKKLFSIFSFLLDQTILKRA